MMKDNKSQFFIFSVLFFLLLLLFIYSLETQNFYIESKNDFYILDNIKYEICYIAKNSDYINMETRFNQLSLDISSYCLQYSNICNLSIIKKNYMPPFGNITLLNYSQFDYNIYFNWNGLIVEENFIC